ncbi:MAG: AMP-binding protein, partial [bacterium]|nr:AMP-binding protein [bacterium]
REYLVQELPAYMIPTYFVTMEKLPVTTSGKVNRKLLPQPVVTGNTATYIPPRGRVEKTLVEMWSKMLDINENHIGIDDNFFHLGGHSLKATQLIANIHKALNVAIQLPELFSKPTIRALSTTIGTATGDKFFSIKAVEKKENYPLSSAQKRQYILQQIDESSTVYNMPTVLILKGEPDREKLERTAARLIERHESLRTSFEMINETPRQRVWERVTFELEYSEIEASEGTLRESDILKRLVRPFKLSQAPLMRGALIKTAVDRHILFIDMHHIISDGISATIFHRDFSNIYAGKELPPLRIQYKDFSVWQTDGIQKEKTKKQQDYWLNLFEGELPALNLPTDFTRPAIQSFEGDSVDFSLEPGETVELEQVVLKNESTLFMVLLALFNILLAKVCGREDIVVGSPVAGRRHSDLENIVGMFVNTLALRNYPREKTTFTDFLSKVRENTLGAFENQSFQYEELVEQVCLERDPGHNPLFDVMFVLQNTDVADVNMPGLNITPYPYENKTSKFDLTLSGVEGDGKLWFSLGYCTKLFKRQTIERFIGYYKRVIRLAVEDSEREIAAIELLTLVEKRQVLLEFNDTAADYPEQKRISQIFEEQVRRRPDAIALSEMANAAAGGDSLWRETGAINLTYRQLDDTTRRLARILKQRGVTSETIVALWAGRSLEMLIGIVGILKVGGAYMPLDPDYPEDRITFMLKDSNTDILLTPRKEVPGVGENKINVAGIVNSIIYLDEITRKTGTNDKPDTAETHGIASGNGGDDSSGDGDDGDDNGGLEPNRAGDIAYIMYTSGSTGRPKGVMVTQRNVTRLVLNTNYVALSPETRVLQTGAPVFDATTFEIWGPLLNGGRLVLVDKEI